MDAITNFTFQYVSINTHFSLTEKDQLNLFFTFQYVSINTTYPSRTGSGVYFFTFQYVSINTGTKIVVTGRIQTFTFQYVSINTSLRSVWRSLTFCLYIPICFY